MKLESHVVDAFREGEGPGVLGRMLDILERHGYAVGATAVNSRPSIVDGNPKTGRLADIISTEGVSRVFDRCAAATEETAHHGQRNVCLQCNLLIFFSIYLFLTGIF